MRLLRASDHVRMPWKNGGGVTTEIWASPEGAGLDAFDWRISMADVARDGPFSAFPGIDRTLAVLRGRGMRLSINGGTPVLLDVTSPPLAFPGDVPVAATLVDGPILDLNIMTRRGRFTHTVARIGAGAAYPELKATGTLALVCHGGRATIETGAEPITLSDGDAMIAAAGDGAVALRSADPAARVFAITLVTAHGP